MAYISDKVQTISTATASKAATMPVHASGDFLLAIISNDTGGTPITVTAGWTQETTQSANLSQRLAIYKKTATSSSETLTVSGANDDWNITVMAIKEFDATTPIHASARYNMPSNAVTCPSPSLTTTNDNCLIIHAWSYRVPSGFSIQAGELINVSKPLQADPSRMQVVGYKTQFTAGALSTITALSDTAGRGGTSVVIAINDAGNGKVARSAVTSTKTLSRYGAFSTSDGYTAALAANKMSTTSISSIGGVSVSSTAPSQVATDAFALAPYGYFLRLVFAETAGAGLVVGTWHSLSSEDFTDAIVHLNWAYAGFGTASMGNNGLMIGFEDSSGNYAVFRLSKPTGLTNNELYSSYIAADKATPIYSSGTMDWTDVSKVIYALDRIGVADGSRFYIRDLGLTKVTTLVGGNVDRPLSPTFLPNVLEGWGQYDIVKYQGLGQIVNRTPVQIGDGTSKTYYAAKSTAYEFPLEYDADSATTRFANTPADSLSYVIKASSADTIYFRSCLMQTSVKQDFIIHSASSTSATYSFSGMVLSGYSVTGKTGITFDEATFDGCYKIDLMGGGLDASAVSNSLDSIAVTTTDPGAISNTGFISAGTGHAIEITTPGTYVFTGNSFSGYGANTTTDAAIYNNSGGAVTLQLGSGYATPTVRDGAGASTAFDTPSVDIAVDSYDTGSTLQIYNVTQDAEIYADNPSGTSFDYTVTSEASNGDIIRIRVTKQGRLEFTRNQIFSSTSGASFLVEQVDDDIETLFGIDGSTVTEFTWDGTDIEVDLDDPDGVYNQKRFYAWYKYYITTVDGIRNVFGLATAIDAANIRLANIYWDNLSANSATPEFDIRIFREDGEYPQKPTTTGGGGIGFYASGNVLTNIVNTTGTPVVTGDITDIPAELSSQFDAIPTASENATATEAALSADLTAILSNTDATQAKVDQL